MPDSMAPATWASSATASRASGTCSPLVSVSAGLSRVVHHWPGASMPRSAAAASWARLGCPDSHRDTARGSAESVSTANRSAALGAVLRCSRPLIHSRRVSLAAAIALLFSMVARRSAAAASRSSSLGSSAAAPVGRAVAVAGRVGAHLDRLWSLPAGGADVARRAGAAGVAVGGQRPAVVLEVGQPGTGAAGVLVQDGAPGGGQLGEQRGCAFGFGSDLLGAGQ